MANKNNSAKNMAIVMHLDKCVRILMKENIKFLKNIKVDILSLIFLESIFHGHSWFSLCFETVPNFILIQLIQILIVKFLKVIILYHFSICKGWFCLCFKIFDITYIIIYFTIVVSNHCLNNIKVISITYEPFLVKIS